MAQTGIDPSFCIATNSQAWAIGSRAASGQFRIRRVVWGRLLANAERQPGEEVRRANVLIRKKSYGADRDC